MKPKIEKKNINKKFFEKKIIFPKFYRRCLSFFLSIQNLKDFIVFERSFRENKNSIVVCLSRELGNISKFFERVIFFDDFSIKDFIKTNTFPVGFFFKINHIDFRLKQILVFYKNIFKTREPGYIVRKELLNFNFYSSKVFSSAILKFLSISLIFNIQNWIAGISQEKKKQGFFAFLLNFRNKIIKKKIPFFINLKNAKKIFICGKYFPPNRGGNLKISTYFSSKMHLYSFENFIDFFGIYFFYIHLPYSEEMSLFFEFWMFLTSLSIKKEQCHLFGEKILNQKFYESGMKRKLEKKLCNFAEYKIQKKLLIYFKKITIIYWEIAKLEKKFYRKIKIFKENLIYQKNNFLRFIFWIKKKYLIFLIFFKTFFYFHIFSPKYYTHNFGLKKRKETCKHKSTINRRSLFLKKDFFSNTRTKDLLISCYKIFACLHLFYSLIEKKKTIIHKKNKTANKFCFFFIDFQKKKFKKVFIKIISLNERFEKELLLFSNTFCSISKEKFFFFFLNIRIFCNFFF